MNKAAYIILILISNILAADYSYGLNDSTYIGFYSHYNFNHHISSFRNLPGVPNCCPKFTGGDGTGFSFGIFYDWPLPENLSISLRASFNNFDVSLQEFEPTKVRVGTDVIDGRLKHIIDASISDLALEPVLNYRVFDGLQFHFGGHLGYFTQKNYSQYEELTDPAGEGVFTDTGTRRRNENSGKIDDPLNVFASMIAGISYRLPMNSEGSLFLSPEIFYLFNSTNIVKNLSWRVTSLKIGAAIRYTPIYTGPEKQYIKEKKIDTVYVTTDDITLARYVKGKSRAETKKTETRDLVTYTETEFRTDTIHIMKTKKPEEVKPEVAIDINIDTLFIDSDYVSGMYPLLPVVFFDKNSAGLRPFYSPSGLGSGFDEDSLPANQIDIQKDILNIIGSRLSKKKNMTITVRGFADKTTENSDCGLARKRAEAVRNYLVGNWKIDKSRIHVITGNTDCSPQISTETETEQGYADNRRVEIGSSDIDFYKPIIKINRLRALRIKPDKLVIKPVIKYKTGISGWKAAITDGDKVILSESGSKPENIDYKLTEDFVLGLKNGSEISVEYLVKDSLGNAAVDTRNIYIKRDPVGKEVRRIALILFDVEKSSLSDYNKKNIAGFFAGMEDNIAVKITGYTDILGDYEKNKKLSEKRAQSVADFIKSIKPHAEILSVEGLGPDEFPKGINSYDTENERFLCRTVLIEIFNK